jgi:hypothetical protein
MDCPCCESSMTVLSSNKQTEGETGGMWQREKLECATCGCQVVHEVFEKIGSVREAWSFERLSANPTARTALHCPVCDASLVSAWPQDARPAPATSFSAERAAHGERRTDYVCADCLARYIVHERVDTEWRTADSGAAIASPRPYPRSK